MYCMFLISVISAIYISNRADISLQKREIIKRSDVDNSKIDAILITTPVGDLKSVQPPPAGDLPVDPPVDPPVDDPADDPADPPVDDPADDPADPPVDDPADDPPA
eukprot:NODE_14_length_42432_cov_0.433799.p26 type:complete len:106 gc:universal NODE_14_length_42432_cov_0.433799:5206-4889(-)